MLIYLLLEKYKYKGQVLIENGEYTSQGGWLLLDVMDIHEKIVWALCITIVVLVFVFCGWRIGLTVGLIFGWIYVILGNLAGLGLFYKNPYDRNN